MPTNAASRKIKTTVAVNVQTREQMIDAIGQIGTAQRERERIKADMNDAIDNIKKQYDLDAAPHAKTIKELSAAVAGYCNSNRDELTGGKKKTVKLATGVINWRKRPARCSVRNVVDVLQALKQMGLDRYIRIKEELNKEMVLAEPEPVEHIKGISIGSEGENFVITPNDTELEEVV